MKRASGVMFLVVANIILALFTRVPYAPAQEYAASEILVKFKSPTKKAEAKSANKFRWQMDTRDIRRFGVNNVRHMQLPPHKKVRDAIIEAYKDSDVLYAEPNYIIQVNQIPNDPVFSQLWGMEKIQAPQAWDITTGSSGIIIAVIDTGVDYNHEDISANMWTGPAGEHGYDFCNNDADPMDDNGHGTHVAGTIGAVAGNNKGVAGVCWNVKIMALKFLNSSGSGYLSDAISAIQYAIDNGAHILSNSWGGGGYSQAIVDAIMAANDAGSLFVVSAGNDGVNNDNYPHYPSNYEVQNIISVAASDQNDNLAPFSCYGQKSVDLAAPGVSILSTIPGNRYNSYSGTSMACPHVSGACGLIWAKNPGWTNLQVKEKLLQSVDRPASLEGKVLSGGRLNVLTVLGGGDSPPPEPPTQPQPPAEEPAPAGQPDIEIEPASIPLVQLAKGGSVTKTIKIKNTGTTDLVYSIANENIDAVSELFPYEPEAAEAESEADTINIDNTEWHVVMNKRTGGVHRAFGGTLGITGLSAENMDESRVEHLSRDFVDRHYDLLNVYEKDLLLKRNERHGRQWYVSFQETYNNIPVYNAGVELRYSAVTGQLILFGSDAYKDIDVPVTPLISIDTAHEIAKNDASFNEARDQIRETQLIIFPIASEDGTEYYLSYMVSIFTESPPHLWIYIINAVDGSIITKWDGIRHLEINGTVKGKIHPFYPADTQILEEFADETINISGANSANTDSYGYYKTDVPDSGSRTVTAGLNGPHVDVINLGGPDASYSDTADTSAPHNIQWDDSNSDATERDVYYHSVVSVQKIKEIDPGFTGVDYSAPSKVNIPNYTNAYFDGYGYGYGDGNDPDFPWVNLGQVCDSMYHEYGHGIMHFQYNQYWGGGLEFGAMHEGLADYFACTITDEPMIGEELGYEKTWRDIDVPNATPSNTIPESHDRGRVIGGALWDLRKVLGAGLVDHLFHFARYGHATTFYDYYVDLLLEDDDDGYYNNGTPHSGEIYSAFALHDIAYFTPSDPNDTTAPAAVNDLAAVNSTYYTIALRWTAPGDDGNTGQAHSYDIRYSNSYITNANWQEALQVAGEAYPRKAGETETAVISGLNPDTAYYIALKARDNKGNWSLLSNIAERITTSAVIIYTNDMEGDTSGWTPGSEWAVAGDSAHSGTYSWTDSPGRNYYNNTNTSLISPSFNLTGCENTSLSFWHKHSLENDYDYCYVEVSNDNGTSWKTVKSFKGESGGWSKAAIDLSGYDEQSNVKIRFRLYTNFTGAFDGWHIDDVVIMAGTYPVIPNWLTAAPVNGTIPAGSEETIRLTYNTYSLDLGIYETTLSVVSNDPDTAFLELSAKMEVVNHGSVTPSAPVGLTASEGNEEVWLAWQANTESDIAGYNIYRKQVIGSTAIRKTGRDTSNIESKQDEALSLVKVFLTETGIDPLLGLGITVYADIGVCAIAEVTDSELAVISDKGFSYKILDTDSGGKQYYLVWAHVKEKLGIIGLYAEVLDSGENSAIIHTDKETIRGIQGLGLQIKHLRGRPLLLGEKTAVSYGLSSAGSDKQNLINEMVSKVQESSVRNYIQTLQDYGNRYVWNYAYDQSAEYALGEFQNMGFSAGYHQFVLQEDNSYVKNNVIATITGASKPDEIFIICGHLDTVSNCPGAEDNASGSAMVMEAARVLSQYKFDSTIKFILFGAEEEWFEGSETFVNEMADSGANLAGALNFDMIAYMDTPNKDILICSHTSWQELAQAVVQAANTYTDIQAYNYVDNSAWWSDHWSFWQRNYPAICGIEYSADHFYPWYHQPTDTIDKINTSFAAEVAKLGIAALAELANPVISAPPPEPVFEKINNTLVQGTSYSDTTAINNITYQYVITAVNVAMLESAYSDPVSATPYDNGLPVIKITHPADGSSTYEFSIEVAGTVNKSDARVTVNGLEAALVNGAFSKTIGLSTGANQITVTAVDPLGNTSLRTVTVVRLLGPQIDISPSVLPGVELDIGQTKTQSLTITNTGDDTLTFNIEVIGEGGAGSVNAVVFSDDMESGTSKWYVASPWALVTTSSYSPTHSWHDSPGGNYGDNVLADITTIPIDLSSYTSATLTFWHKYELEMCYDFGSVYASRDHWATWEELAWYTDTQAAWAQETVDLSSYTGAGNSEVEICFEIYTDSSVTYDGWYIDDVVVTASGPANNTSWLSVDTMDGTVEPKQSKTITLTYNTLGLSYKTYTASMNIYSNDSANPVITKSISLNLAPDTTPPDSPTINPVMSPTNSTTQIISGSMSSDTKEVSVVCAAASIGVVYYNGGTWECTLTNLKEGANNISASAIDIAGNESPPAGASITVDTTSPSKVAGLAALDTPEDNGSSITLSWAYNKEGDVSRYNIYRSLSPISNAGGLNIFYSTTRNSYMDNTAADGIDYYYAVTAVDTCGNEDKEVIGTGPVSSMDNLYY